MIAGKKAATDPSLLNGHVIHTVTVEQTALLGHFGIYLPDPMVLCPYLAQTAGDTKKSTLLMLTISHTITLS